MLTSFQSFGVKSFGQVWRVLFEDCQFHSKKVEVEYNGQILPFAEYAAHRLLDTHPESPGKSDVFEAVRTISGLYLRADVQSISDCIAVYGLDNLLEEHAHGYRIFMCHNSPVCRSFTSMGLVKDLMALLESLMIEYLGCCWDRVDQVLAANEEYLSGDGMVCVWIPRKPNRQGSNRNSEESDVDGKLTRAQANWQRAYRVAIKEVAMKTLGTQRKFKTLTQMFQELNRSPSHVSVSDSSGSEVRRRPILLLLGGGMAAGKSTVREIIGSDGFWSAVGKDAVIVEADAVKNQDVVFKVLSDRLGNDPSISSLVHEYSTGAAESMLVAAVNEQKDIVFDGTMTWLPFVEQTIAMVRDHTKTYIRGPGYHKDKAGCICEEYWKVDGNIPPDTTKLPYKVEFVGVTCDPALAVGRGIWRKLRTGRGVPVSSQLRSHRLFSENFEKIAGIVDSATLYHTGTNLTTFTRSQDDLITPKVIAHVSKVTRGDMLVNPTAWREFQELKQINDNATGRATLSKTGCKQKPQVGRTLTKALTNLGSGNQLRQSLKQAHLGGQ